MQDLNIFLNIILLEKKNTEGKLIYIGLDNNLMDVTWKAYITKAKTDQKDYIKLKSFCTANQLQTKKSDKGLIFKIYKNSYNSTAKN